MDPVDRWRGCLLGLACGDAVGTTVEFSPRGTFAPVTDMVGGGPFDLLPGQWTDDTSMALCLLMPPPLTIAGEIACCGMRQCQTPIPGDHVAHALRGIARPGRVLSIDRESGIASDRD